MIVIRVDWGVLLAVYEITSHIIAPTRTTTMAMTIADAFYISRAIII